MPSTLSRLITRPLLSAIPSAIAPEDSRSRTVSARLNGWGIPTTNNTVAGGAETNFFASPSRIDGANSQLAVALVDHASSFNGDGLSIGGSVRTYSRNQFMAGFPCPVGTGQSRIYWRFVVDAATDQVLGMHMVGSDAGEVIQGFAVAVQMGVTKAQLDRTIGIHPTVAEEFVTMREPAR